MVLGKKVVVDRFGGPEVLRLTQVTVGDPGPGEILLRVEAAGVLYGDVMRRRDRYISPTPLPYSPGTEVAGIVLGVGDGVERPAVGDRVVCWVTSSGYAQYAVTQASRAVSLPDQIPFAEGTALLAQGVTAYLLTHDVANLKGRSVFIESAAGGVGSQMVQMARSEGATLIVGSASSEEKRSFARKHGVDLAVDSTRPGWSAAILEATGGRGIEVGYESSGASFQELMKCLTPFGTIVKFGRGVDEVGALDPAQVVAGNQTLRGFYLPGYLDPRYVTLLTTATQALMAAVSNGDLTVSVGQRYALEDAEGAHRAVEGRLTTGKVVLEPWR